MIEVEEFSVGIDGDIIPASSGKTNNITLSKTLSYVSLWVAFRISWTPP